MNISQYLSSQNDDFSFELTLAQPKIQKYHPKARKLALFYGEFQRIYNGRKWTAVAKSPSILKSFSKCLERIDEWQKKYKVTIDLIRYLRVHFEKFKIMGPNRLLYKESWDLYQKDLVRDTQEVKLSKEQLHISEERNLQFLMQCRNESREEALNNLKKSGIFSDSFLKANGVNV